MNLSSKTNRRSQHAFSLIEMIGVLVVIALLVAILVPSLLRQIDRLAGEKESAYLKSLSDALQQSILRNRYIPAHTNWTTVVATELGVDVVNVSTNIRKQPRVFLMDPLMSIGVNGGGLPYSQNNTGSVVTAGGYVIPPVNPRVLILSSLGSALPTFPGTGIATDNDFTNIWNATEGAVPAGPAFTSWAGEGSDLKVQRINLSPLFVRLVLTTYAATNTSYLGRYAIDWKGTNDVPINSITNSSGIEGYFIQNSILGLINDYASTTALDSQQILIRNNSFVYDQRVWRGSITGISPLGGLDIGSVVDKFLSAYPNPNAPTNAQATIVATMMDYMNAYEAWALGNDGLSGTGDDFPSGTTGLRGTALTMQDAMMTAVQSLYLGSYYPPEVACP